VANSVAGLFETLVVPAATNGKLTPRFKNRGLDVCFNGYRSSYGTVGQTTVINVPIVDETKVTNIGSGAIALSDTATTPVNIVINQKLSSSRRIQSWDQIRSPLDLQEQYLQPMVEEVLRKSNRAVTSLFNPTAFPTYAVVAGGSNVFTRLNISSMWENVLGTGGAPESEVDNFFITDQVAYGTMVGDSTQNFIQQFVVGEAAAVAAQQSARMMPVFGAMIDWDQTVPTVNVGKHGGLFFNRYAIGLLPVLEPAPKDSYIRQMVMYPTKDKKFPLIVQFWHDPNNQGHVLHVFSQFGVAVINPAWGSYAETV
jgi:hypothetical protein